MSPMLSKIKSNLITIKFLTVGLLNTLVGLFSIYAAMYYLKLDTSSANILGYSIGIAISFILNKTWTFQNNDRIVSSFIRYLIVISLAYLVNLETVIFSVSHFKINPYLSQILGIFPYTAIGYFGCKLFVFNNREKAIRIS